jgi:hypothetical protein
MSHFTCLVLVKDNVKQVEKEVDRLMAPFSESKRFPKREEDCHCVGRVARHEAEIQAEKEFPKWDDMRKLFREKNPKIDIEEKKWHETWKNAKTLPITEVNHLRKAHKAWEKAKDRQWQAFIAPKEKFIKDMAAKHPMNGKPDPTCGFYSEEMLADMKKKYPDDKKIQKAKPGDRYSDKSGCGATGKVMTTCNPDAHWDWFEIGGRWTGRLVEDYDPYRDPDNLETCWMCKGTGKRDDELGRKARAEDPTYTCNVCDGSGQSVKHQLKRFPGDILPTRLVPKDIAPHAIVTPDGKWHQESKMGWFAMTWDEDPDWDKKVAEIMKTHRENTVTVLVDCHI